MFLALFIFIAGLLTLLQNMGVITTDVHWGMPVIIMCVGLHLVYQKVKAKKR